MAKPPKPSSDDAGEAPPPKKKMAGKTLVLFIILPALLIVGGGGTTAFLLLSKPPQAEAEAGKDAKPKKEKKDAKGKKDKKDGEGEAVGTLTEGPDGILFYKLPDLLVNISGADGRAQFLKLKLTVEASDPAVIEAIEPSLPRVMDQFQAFLREVRVEDVAGSAGAHRLRLELLRRINIAIAPAQADAVLIEEMLVQ